MQKNVPFLNMSSFRGITGGGKEALTGGNAVDVDAGDVVVQL